MEYLRILLVDADRNDYQRTRNLLGEAGTEYDYDIEWSPDFESGMKAVTSAKHDLYLIDFNIGSGRALELLRKTQESGRRTPAIVVDGNQAKDGDRQAMELGAADFLSKADLKADSLDRAIRYALGRKEAGEYQQIMRAELEHRVKNIFNQVLSIARHTMRGAESLAEFKEVFEKRIVALAQINTLLSQKAGEGASMAAVVSLFAEPWERIKVTSPAEDVRLIPRTAQAMFMSLYELSIVSVKHGSLSMPEGTVDLRWEHDPEGHISMHSTESGGPDVYYPEKTGNARKLIELMIEGQLQGALDFNFAEGGIRCRMSCALEREE